MPWVAGEWYPQRARIVPRRPLRGEEGDMRRWSIAERIQGWEVGDKSCVMSVIESVSFCGLPAPYPAYSPWPMRPGWDSWRVATSQANRGQAPRRHKAASSKKARAVHRADSFALLLFDFTPRIPFAARLRLLQPSSGRFLGFPNRHGTLVDLRVLGFLHVFKHESIVVV